VRLLSEVPDAERLARLETQMINMENHLKRIEGKIDSFSEFHPTRNEVNEKFRLRDEQIRNLQDLINEVIKGINQEKLTNRTNFPAWVMAIISASALIVSILTAYKG
jgi:hypothetical protein